MVMFVSFQSIVVLLYTLSSLDVYGIDAATSEYVTSKETTPKGGRRRKKQGKKKTSRHPEEVLRIMEYFDIDKDDELSIGEIRTAASELVSDASSATKEGAAKAESIIGWEKGFPKADADEDGYLTPGEINALKKKMWSMEGGKPTVDKELMALMFLLYDANPPPEDPKRPEDPKNPEDPKKPQEKPKVNITEAALSTIDRITSSLAEGTEPPAEMLNLKVAIETGEESRISSALYLSIVQQTLDYDMHDGKMVPTIADFTNATDPTVHEKMKYVYSYGVKMAAMGYFSIEVLTDVVVNTLARRVNMDGPSFESWLEVKGFLRKDEAESKHAAEL